MKYIVWCEDLEIGFTTSCYQTTLDIANNNTEELVDSCEYPGIASLALNFCDLTEDCELIILTNKDL